MFSKHAKPITPERIVDAAKDLSESGLLQRIESPSDAAVSQTLCELEDLLTGTVYTRDSVLQLVTLTVEAAEARLGGKSGTTLSEHLAVAAENIVESLQARIGSLVPKASPRHDESSEMLREALQGELAIVSQTLADRIKSAPHRSLGEHVALLTTRQGDRIPQSLAEACDGIVTWMTWSVRERRPLEYFGGKDGEVVFSKDEFARYTALGRVLTELSDHLVVPDCSQQLPSEAFKYISGEPILLALQEKVGKLERLKELAPEIPLPLLNAFERSLEALCRARGSGDESPPITGVVRSMCSAVRIISSSSGDADEMYEVSEPPDIDRLVSCETARVHEEAKSAIVHSLGETDGSLDELVGALASNIAHNTVQENVSRVVASAGVSVAPLSPLSDTLKEILLVSIFDDTIGRMNARKMLDRLHREKPVPEEVEKLKAGCGILRQLREEQRPEVRQAFFEFEAILEAVLSPA